MKSVDHKIGFSGEEFIDYILFEILDSTIIQPIPLPITDVLLYKNDLCDGWKKRITVIENCLYFVGFGRITHADLIGIM